MTSQQPESRSNPLGEAFRNRGFLACIVLLIAATGAYKAIDWTTGGHIIKLPAPLRKPLPDLDMTRLAPYELVRADDIKEEMLENLGTKEYIQWTLRDTTAPRNSPAGVAHLFVTYYTDNPGQVVHVPEECFVGGGFTQAAEELSQVSIPDLQQTVAVKLMKFEKQEENIFVMYLFHVNGKFATDSRVTTIMNDPLSVHGYFSKVEVSFPSGTSSEQALEAGKQLLQKVLPVLVKEHWPDWQELEHPSVPQSGKTPPQTTSQERGN